MILNFFWFCNTKYLLTKLQNPLDFFWKVFISLHKIVIYTFFGISLKKLSWSIQQDYLVSSSVKLYISGERLNLSKLNVEKQRKNGNVRCWNIKSFSVFLFKLIMNLNNTNCSRFLFKHNKKVYTNLYKMIL